jgi:release factor glutamine methyltransferase
MQIADALAEARARGVARLDAQLLLGHLLGRPRVWLIAHDTQALTAAQADDLRVLLARRADGEPLAYLVGEREFHGLSLQVTPAVLVPRPETELLVDWALQRLQGIAGTPQVVDLGTGSGAVALAIARDCPRARVCASDASAEALDVAGANARRHGLAVEWLHGDWWAPFAGRRFALAVSNPPYVAAADPHLVDLRHEPQAALTPGGDGLAALRRIVEGAPAHLLPAAWLLLEHGHDQAAAVRSLLGACGFVEAETRHDLAGLPRCTGAVWPGEKSCRAVATKHAVTALAGAPGLR